MKAIIYRKYGGPEVLELAEVPEPKLSQTSVVVRVKAAGVNPADYKLQSGIGDSFTDAWFPVIPGWDVAGIVEQVGAGVSEFQIGDEVIGYLREEILHSGTYAEKVSGPVDAFVRKPSPLTWAEAAGLPLPGLTAYRAVVRALKVQRDETCLIYGAAGAVGSLAVQIARDRGARVIGVDGGSQHQFLLSIGAEPVTFGEEAIGRILELVPNGVDVILDCAGHGSLRSISEIGNKNVRVGSIVEPTEGAIMIFARRDPSVLAAIAELAESGKLVVRVGQSFPLAEAADAHRLIQDGRARGKIVLELP